MCCILTVYLLIYLCETADGSSGSPLIKTTCDGHHKVIALHRGYTKLNGDGYNYGTSMGTIIDHIHGKIQSCYCEYPYTFLHPSMYLIFTAVDDEDDMAKKIADLMQTPI